MGVDDSLTVTKDLKTILKESRLDRHKILKISQRYRTFKQLPAELVRKVSKYQLVWIRHKVVFIQFIAHIFRSHLTANRCITKTYTDIL